MNTKERNLILWMSIILNIVLSVAIFIMSSSHGRTVEEYEQKVSEYEAALMAEKESSETANVVAMPEAVVTTTTAEPDIEATTSAEPQTTTAKTTAAAKTDAAVKTTTAAKNTTSKTTAATKATTAKTTTTTKAATTTQKPTTTTTKSGDNDGLWVDGWY